jgi:hypothetical protein
MRPTVRRANRTIALLLGAVLLYGCGGKSARAVNDLNGITEGTFVRLEGELSLRGSTPFPTLVLLTTTGAAVTIDSRSSQIQHELKGLLSMRVVVEGTVVTSVDPTLSRLDASYYELLPLPGGEIPIVGTLTIEAEQCVLTATDGSRYWMCGDLVAAIREYDGACIWVVGEAAETTASERPKKSTPFTPTGYGVISEVSPRPR